MIHFVIMLTRVPIQDCGPKGAVSTPVDKCGGKKNPRKPDRPRKGNSPRNGNDSLGAQTNSNIR